MRKTFILILLGLLCSVGNVWAETATVTLSGATTKATDNKETNKTVPSIAASPTTITTGTCNSSFSNASYYLSTYDNQTYSFGGATYYLSQPYNNGSKAKWSNAGTSNQYGTFTIPSGYTFNITKVSHAIGTKSAAFTAKIIVKDAGSTTKYTSGDISVTSGYNPKAATDINLAVSDQVLLTAGTYTLNVNLSSTNSNTGKYAGIEQVVLTGDLESTIIDTESPSITTDLDDEYTVDVKKSKTLLISASHYTGFQWYECDDAEGTNPEIIEGATSSAYSFTPDAVGTRYFYCVVTNTNATPGTKTATSNIATVTIEPITPAFELASTSIVEGKTTKIQVVGKSNLDGLTMNDDLTYDDAVISINASGVVTAISEGTSSITFTTDASGNYAAGSASLSITVTGKVVASSTPNSWSGCTARQWSVSTISLSTNEEGGSNGFYVKAGSSNAITSGSDVTLKSENIIYFEVPQATSEGIITFISSQNQESRYLQLVNSEETKNLTMAKAGQSVRFDENSIEEIDGKYYIKLSHGSGDCKFSTNVGFVTVMLKSITPTPDGYATFCAPFDAQLSENVTAYTGTYSDGELTLAALTGTNKDVVPANTPVVLKSSASPITISIASKDAGTAGTNHLKAGPVTRGDRTDLYVLGRKGSSTAFFNFNGDVIAPNKAYLKISNYPTAAPGVRIIIEENNATDINNTESTDEVVKFIQNGQLYIKREGIVYDAMGRVIRK